MTSARAVTSRTFLSLGTRNYRLFFFGQLVSVTGSWLQSTAQAWLILELTHSALMLGLLIMVQYLPTLGLQPLGGLFADRLSKRRVLIATQSSFAIVAAVLGIAVGLRAAGVALVFVAVVLFGFINVVDGPARQAFVPEMVGQPQLSNAVALNSMVFNGARVVGPALAGVLIATVGTAVCFDLNAVSYLAAIASLVMMRPGELHLRSRAGDTASGAWRQLKEGVSFASRTPELVLVMAMMLVVGTFSFNLSVFIPALATEGLHSGATGFGLLSAALGFGALLGSFAVAYLGRPSIPVLLGGCAAFGLFLTVSGQGSSLLLSAILLMGAGGGMIVYSAMSNSVAQLFSPARLRGRVMALYLWVFLGTTPFGSPIAGAIEQAWGSRTAMAVGGLFALATAIGGSLWWARRGRRGRLYPSAPASLSPADPPTA